MEIEEGETSSWLKNNSKRNIARDRLGFTTTRCVCLLVSWITTAVLITLIILTFIINDSVLRKKDKDLTSTVEFSKSLPMDNFICLPCKDNTQTMPMKFDTIFNCNLSLCCEYHTIASLISFTKLLAGQSRRIAALSGKNESLHEKDIPYVPRTEKTHVEEFTTNLTQIAGMPSISSLNFTVQENAMYSVYLHLTFKPVVPKISTNQITINISLNDADDLIFSKKLVLREPFLISGYENLVLFENIHLSEGSYVFRLSDTMIVHNYAASRLLSVHQI
ncbi:uncharacterized protein LOC133202553 [Saccostrea echinata]|uniref:uncharacterized protein LOC133202553 n=1 Tax=Saccostrea echinata TaxID=191078 RepID=UPI002A80CFB5|nr:uncharacterized protein LOC133202553 [Saccostrea echinata]